tara:strand:- start:373 stop:681 length:309 start_codon:yes stop_codon:yes gene_type:complete
MKNFFLYSICLLFLYSCQSIKDGLSGKKSDKSDEFLVIKKNPLEMPPDFSELPVPQSEKIEDQSEVIDEDIENLIKSVDTDNTLDSNNRSAEEFVINEINKN